MAITRRQFIRDTGSSIAVMGTLGYLVPWRRLSGAEMPRPGDADWPRFGYDLHNSRFNAREKTIGPSNANRLKMKWKFTTLDGWPVQTTPIVIGDTLFFGGGGYYYALETATGKLKWKFETGVAGDWISTHSFRGTRSSCQYVAGRLYFGTGLCNIHCLDAAIGREIWKTNLEDDEVMSANVGYSPVVHDGRVVVGWTSEMAEIATLDADTGAVRWRFRVIRDIPPEERVGRGSTWTSGAVDEQTNIVYNGTGSPKAFVLPGPMLYSDSILAHDLDTGELLWAFQAHPQNAFDLTFCAHPMIFDAPVPQRLRGEVRHCIGAGNKGGFYCLNRYTGELYWKVMLGPAGPSGGPRFNATATAYNKVFVQNSSPDIQPLAVTAALNAYNGDIEWIVPNPHLQSSPIAVANGVLYQGFDVSPGKVEALDAKTGRRLWEHSLPSGFYGGVAIANGAVYCGNGESASWKGEKRNHEYSIFCFTIDGR